MEKRINNKGFIQYFFAKKGVGYRRRILKKSAGFVPHFNKSAGFTLLEAVIAIGILVIVGGVAVAASTRAFNLQTYSKNRTRAQDLARNQMERIKTMRDSDYRDAATTWNTGVDRCLTLSGVHSVLTKANGFIGIDYDESDVDTMIDFHAPTCFTGYGVRDFFDSPRYEISTAVEYVPDNFNGDDNGRPQNTNYVNERENMRRVTVTVTWEEPFLKGTPEVKLMSYITNDQLKT